MPLTNAGVVTATENLIDCLFRRLFRGVKPQTDVRCLIHEVTAGRFNVPFAVAGLVSMRRSLRDDVGSRGEDDDVQGRDRQPSKDVRKRRAGVDVLEHNGEVVTPVLICRAGRQSLAKVELTHRLVTEFGRDGISSRHDHLSKDVAAQMHAPLELLGQ